MPYFPFFLLSPVLSEVEFTHHLQKDCASLFGGKWKQFISDDVSQKEGESIIRILYFLF